MTLEEQILALCSDAAPLRLLDDEQQEAQGLPGIVNKINALRAAQARGETEAIELVELKRGPGRPKKAA